MVFFSQHGATASVLYLRWEIRWFEPRCWQAMSGCTSDGKESKDVGGVSQQIKIWRLDNYAFHYIADMADSGVTQPDIHNIDWLVLFL